MLKERDRQLYFITTTLFVVYLLFLVWVILFKLEFSLTELDKVREFNFIPFHYEDGHNIGFHFSEVINNMMIFIPVGVYLNLLFRKIPFWGKAALVFTMSLALECSQVILSVGRFDITDLITNTVGGTAGLLLYVIVCALFNEKEKANRTVAVVVNTVAVLLVGGVFLILSLN